MTRKLAFWKKKNQVSPTVDDSEECPQKLLSIKSKEHDPGQTTSLPKTEIRTSLADKDINKNIDERNNNNGSSKLDKFELKTVIGKGSYGKVLLVRSKRNKDKNEYYAMKAIDKLRLASTSGFRSVSNERSVMMDLDFHYIAKLIMSFQTEQKLFIVIEFCPGGTLRFHMQKKYIFDSNMGSLVFYVAEIALALKYLNDRCIIFRDLKAENVLLDADGHAKLCDFGMVKTDVPSWMDGGTTVCGTPNTMAPEVFAHTYYGYSCDWWSLGVIAYEMHAHRFPFYGRTRDELITSIIDDKVRVLRSWPKSYKDFLSAILMKHPLTRLGARGSGEEVLSHALFTDSPYAIDIEKISKRMLPAPIRPLEFDLSQLKTGEIPPSSVMDPSIRITVGANADEGREDVMSSGAQNTVETDNIPSQQLGMDVSVYLNIDQKQLIKSLGGDSDRLTDFNSIRKSDTPLPDYKKTRVQNEVVSADNLNAAKAQHVEPPGTLNVEGFTYDGIVSEHGSKSFEESHSGDGDGDSDDPKNISRRATVHS